MTRHDPLQLLDPVDRQAPAPDGEALLRRILAEPAPAQRRPPRRVRLGLVGAAGAGAAVVALAVPHGGSEDVLASALDAVDQPGTILHYTRVMRMPGETAADALEMEVWQAADGSRERVLTRAAGLGVHEQVVDGERSRTYVGDADEIIVYRERAQRPAPAGGVGAPAMGDPRTLLERAQEPGAQVEELGEAQVRGVDVVRFRVGDCRAHVERIPGGQAVTTRSPLIVSIAKDDSLPVRVEQPACRAMTDDDGRTFEVPEGPTVDYLAVELLPAAGNGDLLEMAPHPSAVVRDGEDIDAAEERAEAGAQSRYPKERELQAGSSRS